jgi:hypothetical protein
VTVINTPSWERKIGDAERILCGEATEATDLMQRHEGTVLAFCIRLLALVRIILEEHKREFPHNRWGVTVVALFTKMISVLRGALTLARSGHGLEVPILTRAALEALITLSFIAQQDRHLRATRWAEFAYISKYKLMRKHPDIYAGPASRNLRRRVRDRARRAERHFPRRPKFWGSSVGCSDLRVMAEKVGMLWEYDSIYWFGSQPTHASAIAVDEHIELTDDRAPMFKVGLSGQTVRREMSAYCSFVIRGLEQLEGTFHLSIASIIEDAKSGYRRTFQGDPLQREGVAEGTST